MTTYVVCESCRSVQDFSQDFAAYASNWVFHNDQGQRALAAYAGSGSGAAPLTFPLCSDHGQCVTARVSIIWSHVDLPFPVVGPVEWPIVPEATRIQITDSGGNTLQDRHTNGPDPNPLFQVPTDEEADTIPDGECRLSNGEVAR